MDMTQAMWMQRKRQHLALSKRNRQLAVTEFVRRVRSMAQDMHVAMRMHGHLIEGLEEPPPAVKTTIDHLEDQIREVYREEFGCELGVIL